MRVWGKVGVGWALLARERTSGGWADVDRFRVGGNHGGWRGDVQRDGIRRDATVHVGIRWMMAMRTRLWPRGMVVGVCRGCAERFLAPWRPCSGDGNIRSAVGVS
jgi:hypothetical protein